jgi:putative flippase GtrA
MRASVEPCRRELPSGQAKMTKAIGGNGCGSIGRTLPIASTRALWFPSLAARLARPLRFLLVGAVGLTFDLALFTIMLVEGVGPLIAGFLALVAATALTWRLNRVFTFERSGRPQSNEAMRYALVTAAAQSTSYAVFAILVSSALSALPQAAMVAGAACGALVSYNGHRLFAFAPVKACADVPRY